MHSWQRPVLQSAVCIALVGLIVFTYTGIVHVNPTTVALTFLLAVLGVAALWGLRYSLMMSVVSALAFNFYFLPPIGSFTIRDTQNWVALGAFLATSVIASQLSERARRETLDALNRRHEIERLYLFSQHLLGTENVHEMLKNVPHHIAEIFGVLQADIYLTGKEQVYRSTLEHGDLSRELLRDTAHRGEPHFDAEKRTCIVPLRIGVRTIGALGLLGDPLSRETLEAMGTLVAIAIEKEAAVDALSRTEASRESERLRTALLDSITHELRTPLTSIKASVTTLRSGAALAASESKDLLAVIEEESDRLNRLIDEAVVMAQLDAHEVKLDLAPHAMIEVIDAVLEGSKHLTESHKVEVRLPDQLPKVQMDIMWIKKVLQHLVDNAAKYSPPGSPIYISCDAKGGRIVTAVADRGAGIDDMESSMIFDKFYRGQSQRFRVQGTGMGLAIVKAILAAHGGDIKVTSQVGSGSVFSFELPMAV